MSQSDLIVPPPTDFELDRMVRFGGKDFALHRSLGCLISEKRSVSAVGEFGIIRLSRKLVSRIKGYIYMDGLKGMRLAL